MYRVYAKLYVVEYLGIRLNIEGKVPVDVQVQMKPWKGYLLATSRPH